MPLTNRVAVVVGATGQLGPAIARTFAHAGARLALVSTQADGLTALARDLGFRESRVMTHVADALSEASMLELASAIEARFQRVDIVLHVVGAYRGGSVRESTAEVWKYLYEVNVQSAVNTMRAFLPLMLENEWGRIVTISSGVTQSPPANAAAYVASKAALEVLTIAAAADPELKAKHITSNVVLIRSLDTLAERARQPDKKSGWVRPEDVAATLLFLCSDEGGAINGARIPVYGA